MSDSFCSFETSENLTRTQKMAKFNLFQVSCILLISIGFSVAEHRHPHSHHEKSHSSASTSNKDHGITAWIQGRNKEHSKEPTKIYFKADSTSEIVLRDLKDIAVHCEAQFPLEILFDGYGDVRISATGSESSFDTFQNETHQIEVEKHSTFALIFRRTGRYICRGQNEENKNKSVSAYVFVPDQKLFISTKTALVSSTENEAVLIPCPVSEPNATVSLVKLEQEDTIVPVTPHFRYNPRKGFTHSGGMKDDLDGTYYCVASYHKFHKAVEFEVVSGPVKCTKRCGPNSKCEIHDGEQICECKTGYEETLVSEQCLKQCSTDAECPKSMSCVPQDKTSFLQEILNINDGRMGESFLHGLAHAHDHENEGHDKSGECKNPCVHTATCSFGGDNNGDLEQCQVMDHKAICFSTGGLSME